MKKILSAICIIGLAGLVTTSFYFFKLFFKAFSDEKKQVILQINEFGEASLELFFLVFLMPFIFTALYFIIKHTFVINVEAK